MIDFLQTLYPDPTGYITIWTLQDQKTYWLPAGNTQEIIKLATKLCNDKKDVYFGVGLAAKKKSSGRTTNETVNFIPGLWFDFDIKTRSKKMFPNQSKKS